MSIFLQNYVSLTEGSRDVALPAFLTVSGWWAIAKTSLRLYHHAGGDMDCYFPRHAGADDFIRYSRMGRACRACAEDLKMRACLASTPTG